MRSVDRTVWRATGSGAMASSLTPTRPSALVCVKLHLSAVGGAAENFTVTINSQTAAVYDTLLFAQDMNAVTDVVWLPEQPIPLINDDVVDFAYLNSNSKTWGLEVIYNLEI